MTIPYTLQKAEQLCREFQYLSGKRFGIESSAAIDCVAVAPFDQENKNRFLIYYLLFDDANLALKQDYQGMLFDVVVIAGAKEGTEMLHESLNTWLAKNDTRHCRTMHIAAVTPAATLVC